MLKRRLCEAEFEWKLECTGPLLIADGRYRDLIKRPPYKGTWTKPNGFPDALFISRMAEDEIINAEKQIQGGSPKLSFYVPGTSLRGPFRAQAERIIRTLGPDANATDLPLKTACDPFIYGQGDAGNGQSAPERLRYQSCSKRLENKPGIPYALACPACKIFGFAGLASRISFKDADINNGFHSVYRDMIGIDRFTGGVFQGGEQGGGANMRFHVLENTTCTTTVTLANFELWHLGLLAYVFRDFQDGLVPIGFGKTKGFGLVNGRIAKITLSYPCSRPEKRLNHLGSLLSEEECRTYDITATASLPLDKLTPGPETDGLVFFKRQELTQAADIAAFWGMVAPWFNKYMDNLGKTVESVSEPLDAAPGGEDS